MRSEFFLYVRKLRDRHSLGTGFAPIWIRVPWRPMRTGLLNHADTRYSGTFLASMWLLEQRDYPSQYDGGQMVYMIEEVEGIGTIYSVLLRQAGIQTTSDYLAVCFDRAGRRRISEKTGLSQKLLRRWANLVDLTRIEGLSPSDSQLLTAAGVDSMRELSSMNPDDLAEDLDEVNQTKHIAAQTPSVQTVSCWVAHAKHLTEAVTF